MSPSLLEEDDRSISSKLSIFDSAERCSPPTRPDVEAPPTIRNTFEYFYFFQCRGPNSDVSKEGFFK